MAEVITLQGENLIAEKLGNHEILNIDTFILSYDPDIDPTAPIDRTSGLPDSSQIVHKASVTQTGYVNPNQVVYSLFMDSTVGPFEFNRMDLVSSQDGNASVAIATMPTQNKVADDPGNNIRGQSMTRNFMTVYDGAQAVTGITVEAATWQIDFMARLHASDELERVSTRDIYGRSCFWGTGFQVINDAGKYKIRQGTGYVEGIRTFNQSDILFDPGSLPKKIWLDVSRHGDLNGVTVTVQPVYSNDDQADYMDGNQVQHYMELVASISSAGVVDDLRKTCPIADHLLDHLVPEAPENDKPYYRMNGEWIEVESPVSWSAPLATEGQTVIKPPYSFTLADVYINGVMQDQNRGAYLISDNEITLADHLKEDDHVQVIIGGAKATSKQASLTASWKLIRKDYSASPGDKLLLDSESRAFTITLPALPQEGQQVDFLDIGGTVENNAVSVSGNGNLIMGKNDDLGIHTNLISMSLLYCGSHYGWRVME
ncbi:phage tail protein [Bacterioplanoides sp.]|uniref:phage tail-collar fiber domain-containing protein n=1 Tax=Bacterioplanoides sp. TaxID=2066072 RepID=UPI003B59D510